MNEEEGVAAKSVDLTMSIEGLAIVRPGDTLVVALKGALDRRLADEYIARIKEACPGLADVLLIPGSVAVAAYRPEDR